MNRKKIGAVLLLLLLFTVGAQAQRATSMRINEVLVVNETNFVDDYGLRSGWIELYNTSAGTVNIAGCFLTNEKENPKKYPIPKGDVLTKIPPRQHTLFWADGKPGHGTFHVNFVLDPSKENYVALYDTDGKTLIDEVVIPASPGIDVSYGRLMDGEKELGILPRVTPSTNNVTLDSNDKIDNFKNNDSWGIGMTITAMTVVFLALILLYLIFKQIGKAAMAATRRNMQKAAGGVAPAHGSDEEISAEVLAVIGTALYELQENVHDVENTVLTINKVTRNYSPWSSKIYSLREIPRK